MGDANEKERGLGPRMEDDVEFVFVVGPTLEEVESAVRLRYHGLSESKWCETVKENREDAHEPIFPVEEETGIEDGLNRREEARG